MDLELPDAVGFEGLHQHRALNENAPVALLLAGGSVEVSRSAIREGRWASCLSRLAQKF